MRGLERLHFYDGQRLQAVDLALEQGYHIQVRRLLNRGLYSPGVVSGLQVVEVDKRHVTVTAGVALDPAGREIVLLEDAALSVPSRPATPPLQGWFLVIQYAEEAEPGLLADCRCGVGTTPPARTREVPTLAWTETWPNQQLCGQPGGQASDCAVVLGLVVLDAACQITKIEPAVRQYAHSAIPGQVHPFALEGEKDVDNLNPKVLHFQIRGGPPDAVLLYLWADAISSLLYTELGSHDHGIGGVSSGLTASDLGSHTHKVDDMQAASGGEHSHEIRQAEVGGFIAAASAGDIDPATAVALGLVMGDLGKNDAILTAGLNDPTNIFKGRVARGPDDHKGDATYDFVQRDGSHGHTVPGPTTHSPSPNQATAHNHSMSGHVALAGNTAPSGSTPYQARDGQQAYSYPDDVHVKLDGTDITGLINAFLGWTKLGDGTSGHTLVTSGTGSIDLIQLGLPLAVGPHKLELRVNSGGGKLLYNLYVE